MLNLFHNLNNYSLIDHNLLNYGLLLGSVTILGLSIYYFSNNILKQNVDIVTDNLPNSINRETITQNIVNNLESKNVSNLDIIVPNPSLNSEVDILLHKADACTQTGSGLLNRTDIDVTRYTDEGLFIPWDGNLKEAMQELLYGMASDNQSISEISPTEFATHIRNNEAYSRYFDKIHDWIGSVPPHVASSNGTYNSEINFIRQVLDTMNSAATSPVVEVLNNETTINLIPQGEIESIKLAKFEEILNYLNLNYPNIASDPTITNWIHSIINSYNDTQLLSATISSDIINQINCNIILWSSGIF